MVRLSSIYINEYWNSEEEQEGKYWYSKKDEKMFSLNELEERVRGDEKDWQIGVIQTPVYNGELKAKSFIDKFYKVEFEECYGKYEDVMDNLAIEEYMDSGEFDKDLDKKQIVDNAYNWCQREEIEVSYEVAFRKFLELIDMGGSVWDAYDDIDRHMMLVQWCEENNIDYYDDMIFGLYKGSAIYNEHTKVVYELLRKWLRDNKLEETGVFVGYTYEVLKEIGYDYSDILYSKKNIINILPFIKRKKEIINKKKLFYESEKNIINMLHKIISDGDMVCCIDCNMDYIDSRYPINNMKSEYKKLLGFANEKNGNIFSVDCDEVKDIMYMANRGLIDALIYCRKKHVLVLIKEMYGMVLVDELYEDKIKKDLCGSVLNMKKIVF